MKALFALILFIVASSASAHDNHSNNVYNSYTSINNVHGIALAIASSAHHFDMGTYETQGSVAIGSYGESSAISFAAAKRYNDLLISASIGSEDGKTGVGVGFTFRFK